MNNWKPEYGDTYWYIDSFGYIKDEICHEFLGDDLRFYIGNIFKTKEQAEFELECRKVIVELKQLSNDYTIPLENYYIAYSYLNDCITVNYDVGKHYDIYFESEDKAWQAVDSVGKDIVLKYYLRVKD